MPPWTGRAQLHTRCAHPQFHHHEPEADSPTPWYAEECRDLIHNSNVSTAPLTRARVNAARVAPRVKTSLRESSQDVERIRTRISRESPRRHRLPPSSAQLRFPWLLTCHNRGEDDRASENSRLAERYLIVWGIVFAVQQHLMVA